MALTVSSTRSSRRVYITVLFAFVFCLFMTFLTFRTSPSVALNGWLGHPTETEHASHEVESLPETYDWKTRSAFWPPRQSNGGNTSHEQMCASFPKHLLDQIQPVLKTGHGVLESRVRPQLNSVSACLSNLLIFSDLDEEFMDHDIIDVIGDIDRDLLTGMDQLASYWAQRDLAKSGALKDANLTALEGWNIDKYKFLAQVSRAWRMRPERRWYVFYEADTYIVWDNVFRLLEQFDPDVPLYFGSPSPGRDGIWFANGGPGAILSRAAVKKLIAGDYSPKGDYLGSKLTTKHWDDIVHDCCGDSVLGWALHNVDVQLSGLWPMFNPHPLQGVPFSDLYWCQPVLTMHKLRPEDEMDLWRWEESRRELHRPLLYKDLMQFLNFLEHPTRDDWDNGGWDGYKPPERSPSGIDPHASFNDCGAACAEDGPCLQWNYHLKGCWFVRSIRLGEAREPKLEKWRSQEVKDMDWTPEDKRFMAGWAVEKVKKWISDRPCEAVEWVTPSTKRIF